MKGKHGQRGAFPVCQRRGLPACLLLVSSLPLLASGVLFVAARSGGADAIGGHFDFGHALEGEEQLHEELWRLLAGLANHLAYGVGDRRRGRARLGIACRLDLRGRFGRAEILCLAPPYRFPSNAHFSLRTSPHSSLRTTVRRPRLPRCLRPGRARRCRDGRCGAAFRRAA